MRPGWALRIDQETGLVEEVCPHDLGHPTAQSVKELTRRAGRDWATHECDGCCLEGGR